VSTSTASTTEVFQFLALRSPTAVDLVRERWEYVRDDEIVGVDDSTAGTAPSAGFRDVDLFSSFSRSPVAKLIAAEVVRLGNSAPAVRRNAVIAGVEQLLIAGLQYVDGGQAVVMPPTIRTVATSGGLGTTAAQELLRAGPRSTYVRGSVLHVLPASLADLGLPLGTPLAKLAPVLSDLAADEEPRIDSQASMPTPWSVRSLGAVRAVLGVSGSAGLADLVFGADGRYARPFALTKRVLFDTLYGLYVLRRRVVLDLDPWLRALAVLQVLESYAMAEALADAARVPNSRNALLAAWSASFPELQGLNWRDPATAAALAAKGLLAPSGPGLLARRLRATAVVHPLIARLDAAFTPFNALTPIGIGDLKVVKQRFRGYRKAEIAHIETVLAGETKTRTHRALDRAENSFTLSSATDTDSSQDTQSTTRYELKNEAEQLLKTDVGLNAQTTLTYKGNPVVDASLSAGATFDQSRSATERSARNFVNEVISKATSRIQTRVASQRSQTRINEVEETNVHGFANAGPEHVSGIYRWLEKVYEARIHNYGRRMLFEFVIPEPAEFYVEAKLHAYVAQLDVPRLPMPDSATASSSSAMPVQRASDIDEAKYRELARTYDLAAFPYPVEAIVDVPLKTTTGELVFQMQNPYTIGRPVISENFTGAIEGVPAGYVMRSVRLSGSANFAAEREGPGDANLQNTVEVWLDNQQVFFRVDETQKEWKDINTIGRAVTGVMMPRVIYSTLPAQGLRLGASVRMDVRTVTCVGHSLSFKLEFRRTPAVLAAWQQAVYDAIARKVNAGGADAASEDLESRRANYRRQLDELKAKSINDILQGRSERWNEQQVRRELKRQCVAMIAKEFDAESVDDLLPGLPGVGTRSTSVEFPVFGITDAQVTGTTVQEATASFADRDSRSYAFSALRVDEARARGRFVQFLEQAFEWSQLSYLFYPYFWARMPQWLQLLSREDPADPLFTEFLQSGSARVLLAVRPGYENAVLHFLATREPWSGGPSPVIGDPLYLPLYDEVRGQQDDLAGATPDGDPWEFTLPTSLVYLESTRDALQMAYPLPTP
jgi:hypothetical protein